MLITFPDKFPDEAVSLLLMRLEKKGGGPHPVLLLRASAHVLLYATGQTVPEAATVEPAAHHRKEMPDEELAASLRAYLDAHEGREAKAPAQPWRSLLCPLSCLFQRLLLDPTEQRVHGAADPEKKSAETQTAAKQQKATDGKEKEAAKTIARERVSQVGGPVPAPSLPEVEEKKDAFKEEAAESPAVIEVTRSPQTVAPPVTSKPQAHSHGKRGKHGKQQQNQPVVETSIDPEAHSVTIETTSKTSTGDDK